MRTIKENQALRQAKEIFNNSKDDIIEHFVEECEEVEAISYDEEGFALFDFVEYIPSDNMFQQNKYIYEFTGSVK